MIKLKPELIDIYFILSKLRTCIQDVADVIFKLMSLHYDAHKHRPLSPNVYESAAENSPQQMHHLLLLK